MNRSTRDKFVIGTQADITSGNACLETPPPVFAKLNADFGPFQLDLCADPKRHLCEKWFGPGSDLAVDALHANWRSHGTSGYANPPYGKFVAHMLRKAKEQAALGFRSTLLLPVRMTRAFHLYVLTGASFLLFCDKRIAFWEDGMPKLDPKTQKPTGALFDSMVVRFEPGMRFSPPRVGTWNVPPHHKPLADRQLVASIAHDAL